MTGSERDAGAQLAPPPIAYDDEVWDQLWEREFDHLDRYRYGRAVWRAELPEDVLGRRVVPELARRWRRRAVVYAVAWAVFTVFWVAIGVDTVVRYGAEGSRLPWQLATLGSTVIGGCLAARAWFRRTAEPS